MIVAEGLPVGLGSTAEWDTRIDGALAGALMAIPAVKGGRDRARLRRG